MKRTALLILLSLTACKDNSKGTQVDVDTAKKLPFDAANDGKRFTVVGYPSISSDIWSSGRSPTVSVNIKTEPGGEGDTVMSVEMPLGSGADKVSVPDTFGPEDIVVYDHDGTAQAYDKKIAVSFTLDLDTDQPPMNMPIFSKDAKGMPVTTPGKMFFHSTKHVRVDAVK